MGERIAYPSVETILQVGGKKAPSGLPVEVVNRFAFLDHINGKPPLREEIWFVDEKGASRPLEPDEMDYLSQMMNRLTGPSEGSFYGHVKAFFSKNNELQFPARLEAPRESGDGIIGESIPDTTVNIEGVILTDEKTSLLQEVVTQLSEKERRLLELYYEKGMTCEQIGQDPMFNVSRSRVQQLRKAVHEKLRRLLTSSKFQEYLTS